MQYIIIIIIAYLLGSIPMAYLMAKWTKNIDIRQYGSGNVGFTNALRTIGKGPAFIVLFGDIGKGLIAALMGKYYGGPVLGILAGVAVLVGHNYPIFLRFKGGKGAASGIGVVFALIPEVALLAVLVWVITTFITRYVSLATILGAITVPVAATLLNKELEYILFGIFAAIFVIYKHRSNITRLLNGTEYKIGEKA